MPDSVCAKCQKSASNRCSRCRSTMYCSTECLNEDWNNHKKSCIPHLVHGIVIRCDRERATGEIHGPYEPIEIRADHPIHTLGEFPSVSKLVKIPLVVYRHVREPWTTREDEPLMDNMIATHLMIDKDTGFASYEYQKQVGSVTVMRKDGKPLTRESIETIYMFHDMLLDMFGEESPVVLRMHKNRPAFDRFCVRYKDECVMNGRTSFKEMSLPL